MVYMRLFKYYVYRHIRLDNNTPFYVGKGSGNRAFTKQHRNQYWHNIVNKHGYRVEIVKYFETGQDAYNFEFKLINLYKNYNLVKANLTDGGDGTKNPNKEVRFKMGSAMRGKNHSLESRQKMSNNWNRGEYSHSKETIEKIRQGNLGKKLTQGQIRRMSEKLKTSGNPNWKGGVCTPNGHFDTIRLAAQYYNCSSSTIAKRCKSKNFKDWYYPG